MKMRGNNSWYIKLAQVLVVGAMLVALSVTRRIGAENAPIHLPTDWSHRHLVFSQPKDLMQRFRLSGNVRYVQQWIRRSAEFQPVGEPWRWRHAPEPSELLHGDWSEDMGTGATVGAGNFPAKFSFSVGTASCGNAAQPDFVVYNTSAMGSGSQATIVAFDNLYSGCTGTVPSTYWAYNTGTNDLVVTSPVLSADGTQVAFIQSTSGGTANLVLLKWKASTGTLTAPVAPTAESASGYRGCTAPCMTTIAFGDGDADITSSPFYDYTPSSDALYVGDATGYLHKFTGVFNGNPPAEAGSPWPVHAATAPLTSPVYDEVSGYVFVDASFVTSNNGGRLHAICATSTCGTIGSALNSGILGPVVSGTSCTNGTSGSGANLFMDAPIVDPTNETIYVVLGNDGDAHSAVFQFKVSTLNNGCGIEVTLGTGSTTGVPVYSGTLDNLYYSGSAGHMYICGNSGGDPTLYQVAVPSNGILTAGAATAGPALTTASTTCGPVVEFYNNPNIPGEATDWIFTSVEANALTTAPISCPNVTYTGCIMSFNVTSGAAISGTTATVGHTTVSGGASGVVVDNSVASGTLAGASQVYFTPLANQNCPTSGGTGGCAIQASQSKLQ
jgi:hypothetical protein